MMDFAATHILLNRMALARVARAGAVDRGCSVYAARARRRQLAQMAAPRFCGELTRSHSPARRRLKNVLLLLALAGIGLALARPQWGVREMASQNFGEDIVFAMDCSAACWRRMSGRTG